MFSNSGLQLLSKVTCEKAARNFILAIISATIWRKYGNMNLFQ